MSQQHKKWIQLVKDKLNEENMTQTHLARACGVKKPTIIATTCTDCQFIALDFSDKLKNRVCDVLRISDSWVDLEEE